MIAYLRGQVGYIDQDSMVLETGGVGFEVLMPPRLLAQLPAPGEEVLILTHMQGTDNEYRLFGFLTRDELKLFKTLLTVSGIGAKGALNIISYCEVAQFYNLIASQDEKSLVKIPGVGKKSAQRIMFELKDKVEQLIPAAASASDPFRPLVNEILEALEALGYQRAEVYPLLQQLSEAELEQNSIQNNIKKVLKIKAALMAR